MATIVKYGKSPAHLKEAATHNQERDEVGEHKIGQVVTENKNGSSCVICVSSMYDMIGSPIWRKKSPTKSWLGGEGINIIYEMIGKVDLAESKKRRIIQLKRGDNKSIGGGNFNAQSTMKFCFFFTVQFCRVHFCTVEFCTVQCNFYGCFLIHQSRTLFLHKKRKS